MKLLQMAKEFSEGFKEGWNKNNSDNKTELEDTQSAIFEDRDFKIDYSVDYDDIHNVAHETYYPEFYSHDKK